MTPFGVEGCGDAQADAREEGRLAIGSMLDAERRRAFFHELKQHYKLILGKTYGDGTLASG